MCELLGLAFNTHPFSRPYEGGTFTFAHNGTLDVPRLRQMIGTDFAPEGQTDSELAMGAVLTWLGRSRPTGRTAATDGDAKPAPSPPCDYAGLEAFLRDLNSLGRLNLLFSDGRRLFCYHDAEGSNGLAWTLRESPFCRVSLRDEDWEVDLDEEKSPSQRGYVIASRPLTDGEPWTPCRRGRLLVIERGTAVFGE